MQTLETIATLEAKRQRLGTLLVSLQFALIAALALLNLPLLQGAPLALAAVLLGKARLEERWMAQVHPGYPAYRSGTWWLVPGIF